MVTWAAWVLEAGSRKRRVRRGVDGSLLPVFSKPTTPVTKLGGSPARMENQDDTEPWFAGLMLQPASAAMQASTAGSFPFLGVIEIPLLATGGKYR